MNPLDPWGQLASANRSQQANNTALAQSIAALDAYSAAQINAMQNRAMNSAVLGSNPYGALADFSGSANTENLYSFRAAGIKKSYLQHPLYESPVSTLKDLWGAKFGTCWVQVNELEALDDLDKSWITIFRRLRALHVLEEVNAVDVGQLLFRLPPE